jgi:RNA polymerase sigma factor for flagellar operon FliA
MSSLGKSKAKGEGPGKAEPTREQYSYGKITKRSMTQQEAQEVQEVQEVQELEAEKKKQEQRTENLVGAIFGKFGKLGAQKSYFAKEDRSPVNTDKESLIREYAPLIKYIAKKIAARLPPNIELDDLMSSGVIGLMDAIEKYDPRRDNKFKTYAEFRIRGAILDELRAQDWVPRSIREKAKQLERCYAKLEQEKGRQATEEEICEDLKLTKDEYYDLLNQVRNVMIVSYDDVSHFSTVDKKILHNGPDGVQGSKSPFSEVALLTLKTTLADAISELPEKQRLVLSLYYYEDLNLKEIGKVLDVTESRVSQLHTQAVLRLKMKLKSHWEELAVRLS